VNKTPGRYNESKSCATVAEVWGWCGRCETRRPDETSECYPARYPARRSTIGRFSRTATPLGFDCVSASALLVTLQLYIYIHDHL